MATKQIAWNTGSGNITLTYDGHDNGTIAVQSDSNNLYEARSAQFTVRTTDGSNIERTITISQVAKERIDISNAVVSASGSTYSGTAKTPTPSVVLDGTTLPSTAYDISYSNNINAGTATITITGKGDYTGTASGTFTISRKGLTIKASNQTITYGNSISQGTSYVTVTGLVSGDSLTGITLYQSTSSVTSSGTITPSDAVTSNGASNYSITYQTGTLVINKASGSISLATSAVLAGYDRGQTGTLYVRSSNSGWALTDEKTVSGYNVYRSLSNYHTDGSYSVMKLTFVNSTGSSMSTTFKVGPATESTWDYTYIATWDAADISSSSEPSSVIYSGKTASTTWTDVEITIPTGTHTLQVVYRKDGSVNNSPDCGYIAIPYDVSFTSLMSIGKTYMGSGSFSYSSSNTGVAIVDSSTGAITIQGVGIATITVNMAADSNYTAASTSYTITVGAIVPIGCILNYNYTGSAQNVELSAGKYKLQCWGAQGGSNAAASAYGITAKAGGKGGYSEGIITLSSKTKVRVYVGGVGTSSAGGFNGGGLTSGSTSHNADNIQGICMMGGGGGSTDIRLSDGALLSRMIVAGGGSGGAMAYKAVTSTVPHSETVTSFSSANWWINGNNKWEKDAPTRYYGAVISCDSYRGATFTLSTSNNAKVAFLTAAPNSSTQNYSTPDWASGWSSAQWANNTSSFTVPSNANYVYIELCVSGTQRGVTSCTYTWSETVVNTETKGQVGFAGGGINGIVYSSAYNIYSGKQNEAGYGGGFGFGRDTVAQTVRYCAGAGGGGWYGGGTAANDSDITVVLNSGGGSGFVNTAANAQYRPSGYTGLQLDSGETKAGNTSIPSTSGGTETGHSGNGYARITRIA